MVGAGESPSGRIAIVGLGSQFPKAKDTPAFWQNILAGRTTFSEIPRDRWKHELFFDDNPRAIDKVWTRAGSFLEDIKSFPALHFGISPRRLEVMDPQYRLLIEATRWALQDAGFEKKSYDRRNVGVFMGISVSEFKSLSQAQLNAVRMAGGDFGAAAASKEVWDALMAFTQQVPPIRAFTLSGSLTALGAAGISQTFDFGGPAYTIDAACASALVAINDAVLQLRAGVIDHALAGGVYINLSPDNLVCFSRIGAISPSGVCRPFDARSDGFVQSDGVGVVVLKRLEDAQREGDRIYAVIRGTGCNNDGRGNGPMAPQIKGQRDVLQRAYADAGVSPASIDYFEAHGTGTAVGDPVEVEALGSLLLEEGVPRSAPKALGSVKGNIGHAMSAAGIAGLLKGIKILEHKKVPPMPGFESPNPSLKMERWPLRVPAEAEAFAPKGSTPLRVAVSSFGFGGTNTHLILEEAPQEKRPVRVCVPMTASVAVDDQEAEAVLVSAPTAVLLAAHLAHLAAEVESGSLREASLADLAYTLNARRDLERFRAVVLAPTAIQLCLNLRTLSRALEAEVAFPLSVSSDAAVVDAGVSEDTKSAPSDAEGRFSTDRKAFDAWDLCMRAALGHAVDFEAIYQGESRRVVCLPETPLQRESYWIFNHPSQPSPDLDSPLPTDHETQTTVSLAETKATESDLTRLFQAQAKLLQKHKEVMAHHDRLLGSYEDA